jgi:hypothetical protein
MPTVAISYRRSDSAAVAGRIFDRLAVHYGEQSVFMDIDNIPFGVDFRSHIRETLLRTDVLIAVIGRAWLGRNADGTARMHEPTDPVRVEIETALERKAPIIPVLIDGAKMPDSVELPVTFGNFAYLNAAEVSSGRDFHAHMERLISAIDRMAKPSAALGPLTTRPQLAGAADKPHAPKWCDDALRYFLVPLVVLLVAHYAIVNSFNLNSNYLRFACVLAPFAAGFALLWIGDRGVGPAAAIASAFGLVGAVGMTVSESLYSGDPILPQTRFEWLDNFQFAATIALSFFVGHLVARMCRALMGRGSGKL